MFCSVVLIMCTSCTGTRVVIICLPIILFQMKCVSFIRWIPLNKCSYLIWIAHSRGLPRSTFYISIKATSLWHLQINLTLSDDLGYFIAVKLMPWFIISSSTNTTIISDCVSMDFPLYCYSDYPKYHFCDYTILYFLVTNVNVFIYQIQLFQDLKFFLKYRRYCC